MINEHLQGCPFPTRTCMVSCYDHIAFWISISGYVAAGGKCYPESASPKSHMGLRHTGTSCSVRGRVAGCCDSMLLQQPAPVHPTGYCEESQGPAMCLEGSCFCVGSQGCIKTNILVISMVNSRLVVHLRHSQCWGLEGSVFENGKCQEPKVFGVNEGGENMLAWWVLVRWCELFCFVDWLDWISPRKRISDHFESSELFAAFSCPCAGKTESEDDKEVESTSGEFITTTAPQWVMMIGWKI